VSFKTSTDAEWAVEEFAEVELDDARLNRRCQELAVEFSKHPHAPINEACGPWRDTKAAYRFFDNERVTPEEILAPHHQHVADRMRQHDLVLAIQDTTFLNYTPHPQTQGLGEIGNKRQHQRGFGMHSTLAVSAAGVPLGLLTHTFFTRPLGEPRHEPNELRKLPIEEKESYRWLEALDQTLALTPDDVSVLTVCDAEADIYDLFVRADDRDAALLVRASADRRLAEAEVQKLWAKVEQQPVVGHKTVHITGNQQRQARKATIAVRFTTVHLKPPWRPKGRKLPPITMRAILVREENPPAGVDDPLEWLLLINQPVADFAAAQQVIAWYCRRPQIEVYHQVLKSGCRVEAARLRTAARLQNYIALMCVVAWRLHWLTYVNRAVPDAPCTRVLSTVEWQALYMRTHRTTTLPAAPPTVHQAVRWIAQLGGFLGRRSDGEPGITAIWRGWQRLQDIALTWDLVKDQSPHVGNR
jgi:hypothetical protein